MDSRFQNSTTTWSISTKFGMIVENEEFEDRDTCFLPGTVHKLRKKNFLFFLFKSKDLD